MKLRFAAAVLSALAMACGTTGSKAGKTALDAQGRPLPVASGDEGHGVSLTGEHAYDDRQDPSGWSGKTGGIGGGPAPESSAKPAVSAPPPAPSTAPSALPPSKELDVSPPSPPSKELQF
jgi:hypothetical protein